MGTETSGLYMCKCATACGLEMTLRIRIPTALHGPSYYVVLEFCHCICIPMYRIGRCGRFGRRGLAINLVTRDEMRGLKSLEQFYSTEIREMPRNVADFL